MSRVRPAPLPVRDGLGPVRVRLRGGMPVADELAARFGVAPPQPLVDSRGRAVDPAEVLAPGSAVWFYRDAPTDETPVPFPIPILHRDQNLLVVDKPHFLATTPRGRHVTQTALVRLRRELDLPELAPAHRLDRLTAGVLMFTVRREVRGAYQRLFAEGRVTKTYLARSAGTPTVALPATLRHRIVKHRGELCTRVEAGEPNAETLVEAAGGDLYRLTPRTGRTHQLRVQLAQIGLPITGDPLYPQPVTVAQSDFYQPLRLLSWRLEFVDPYSERLRQFQSVRTYP